MKRLGLLLGFVAACGTAPAPSTTLPPALPTTTTTTAPTVSYEVSPCAQANPRDWSTLCQAYDLVVSHHVDLPEPSALSAAAAAGVRALEATGGPRPAVDGLFRCTLPHPTFEPVCAEISDRHQFDGIDVDVLVEAAVQGMFRFGLDPFSAYLSPDFADRLDALGSGQVFSLGLIVGARDRDRAVCGPIGPGCDLVVLATFEFGAAERDGVVPGDAIVEIDGTGVEGLSEGEAVALLHGDAGSTTVVSVERRTGTTTKSLVHDDFRFDPVEFEMLSPTIAYLRLNDFSQQSAQLTGQVLQLPEVARASGMILDLRDNPGGLVLAAQAIASQFLDAGLVLVEETRSDRFEWPVIEGGLARSGMALVVLTNRGSASASEVVAAALQERGRATVIGEPTFGKNLVQQVFTARNGGEIRVTIARWTTPDGLDIGVRGLQPDIVVEVPPDSVDDPVLDRALAYLGG